MEFEISIGYGMCDWSAVEIIGIVADDISEVLNSWCSYSNGHQVCQSDSALNNQRQDERVLHFGLITVLRCPSSVGQVDTEI